MPDETIDLRPRVTRETLEKTPQRALEFLRGAGTVPAIHARLRRRGYTVQDQQEGWTLLQATAGFLLADIDPRPPASDARIRDAIDELDGIDEAMVRIVGASLGRHFPHVAERVMDGVETTRGVGAVVVITTLLDRIDALEASDDETDNAAATLLAERGYGPDERTRLRELIAVAQSVPEIVPVDPAAVAASEQRYVEALVRLRRWYEEWSEIARATIERRDHLIRLGLASRRTRTREDEPSTDAEDREEEREDRVL